MLIYFLLLTFLYVPLIKPVVKICLCLVSVSITYTFHCAIGFMCHGLYVLSGTSTWSVRRMRLSHEAPGRSFAIVRIFLQVRVCTLLIDRFVSPIEVNGWKREPCNAVQSSWKGPLRDIVKSIEIRQEFNLNLGGSRAWEIARV